MIDGSRIDFLKTWLIRTTHNPRVLVVDDDSGDRNLLLRALSKFKCEAESCSTAKEAIAKITTKMFQLVFIDIRLTNGTGPSVIAQTVESSTSTHFVLTSGLLYEDIKDLVDSTASILFWPKPITEEQLANILKPK